MTTLAILFLLIALTLYGVQEYYQIKLGFRPQKCPPNVTAAIGRMLDENDPDRPPQGGRMLHLGSGYGDFVLGAANTLPLWQVDGVEQNPTPWLLSNLRSIGKKFSNYSFFIGDITTWALRDYDVVFVNQEAKTLRRWEAALARRLPTGTLLVCCNAQLPRIRPMNTIKIDAQNTLYVYEKRARAVPPPEQESTRTEAVAPAPEQPAAPPATEPQPQQTGRRAA